VLLRRLYRTGPIPESSGRMQMPPAENASAKNEYIFECIIESNTLLSITLSKNVCTYAELGGAQSAVLALFLVEWEDF
jgi:hypothetical protein